MQTCPIQLTSIEEALPPVSAASAAAARVVFDARFIAWWQQFFGEAVPSRCWAAPGETMLRWRLLLCGEPTEMLLHEAEWPVLQRLCGVADTSLRAAIADALLETSVPWLTAVQGGWRSLSIEPVAADATTPLPTLRLAGAQLHIQQAGPALLALIRSEWLATEAAAITDSLSALRLLLCCRLGTSRLTAAQIGSLAEGDCLMWGAPPVGQPLKCQLKLGVGIDMQIDAELMYDENASSIEATSGPQLSSDEAQTSEGADCAELAQLQLPVHFEIDATRLSLSELSDMGPGYVIELPTPVAQAVVRMMCQGQLVGEGQLVAIGSQLAVRITRMGL